MLHVGCILRYFLWSVIVFAGHTLFLVGCYYMYITVCVCPWLSIIRCPLHYLFFSALIVATRFGIFYMCYLLSLISLLANPFWSVLSVAQFVIDWFLSLSLFLHVPSIFCLFCSGVCQQMLISLFVVNFPFFFSHQTYSIFYSSFFRFVRFACLIELKSYSRLLWSEPLLVYVYTAYSLSSIIQDCRVFCKFSIAFQLRLVSFLLPIFDCLPCF